MLEVRFNDFVDVVLIDKGVPDRFRVNHGHWPGGAAVKATRLVDPDLARARQTCFFNLGLASVEGLLGTVTGATFFAAAALVETEEYVPLVI